MKTATRQIKCDRLDVSEKGERVSMYQDGHKVTATAYGPNDGKYGTTRRLTVFQLAQMIRALPDTD